MLRYAPPIYTVMIRIKIIENLDNCCLSRISIFVIYYCFYSFFYYCYLFGW